MNCPTLGCPKTKPYGTPGHTMCWIPVKTMKTNDYSEVGHTIDECLDSKGNVCSYHSKPKNNKQIFEKLTKDMIASMSPTEVDNAIAFHEYHIGLLKASKKGNTKDRAWTQRLIEFHRHHIWPLKKAGQLRPKPLAQLGKPITPRCDCLNCEDHRARANRL